jgi:hypothetical protein
MVDCLLQTLQKNFGTASPKIKEFYDQLRDYEMFKDITASSDLRISLLILVETCLYIIFASFPPQCK